MSANRVEISELGEFGLIDRIHSGTTIRNPSSLTGIGDDAAVIDTGGDECFLLATDMLVEGIHFDLSYFPLRHVGYKSIVVNVSDIAAMNARPEQVTVSLAISNRFSLEAVDELYAGIQAACENYKVDLVGGDTTSSLSGLVLSVSAVGRAKKDKVAYRGGSRPTDIICVTGDLGAAYLGLQVLEREKQVFLSNPDMQPSLEKYEYIVGRMLRPEARTDIIFDLGESGIKPTSMIDISDGLASELLHLSKMSGNGVHLFEDKIPLDSKTYDTAVEFNLDPITCALNGGEDFELLFTISQGDYEKIKMHPDIHFIGYIHDNKDQNVMITKAEQIVPLRAQGWNHLLRNE
ncbi:MAG TPA: thiamine-phosphate kinase [Cyclobacteriaceae bacterium]|nr:thiamine-phosphate kinase [Cyclobacteriaceae bacterium]